MSTIISDIYGGESDALTAKNSEEHVELEWQPVVNCPVEGGERDLPHASPEKLHPVCPTPDTGFGQLSDYLVHSLTAAVMKNMEKLCQSRGIKLDHQYWKYQTQWILSSSAPETPYVVSASAGSGKSTWIEAFTAAIATRFQSDPELDKSLVGIVIVLQKVEDLNQLADVLNRGTKKDVPNMVALQGWSTSGQKLGFCKDPSITRFEDCRPSACAFAYQCELRNFRNRSLLAPIVGLTQERFSMLRSGGNLESILYRLGNDGYPHPRRYLIFDEKFPLAQTDILDKDCIDRASLEFTQLIGRMSATDSRVRSLQQSLSYSIEYPFQMLRGQLRVEDTDGRHDIQAGFCSLPNDEGRKAAYLKFRKFVLEQRREYATKSLREAFAVMDRLYAGEQCLFSKTNGFAITSIAPPEVQFGQCQSIMFDATAEVDEDYHCLDRVEYSKGKPKREMPYVVLNIYTAKELNVSKRAMNYAWKIEAFSQLIAELTKNRPEPMFICTYKHRAEAFAETLQRVMTEKEFRRVLLMPDRERPTLPYFGGTNGSNLFSKAETVFLIGYPRLDPRNYLIQTCSAYGQEQLAQELSAVPPNALLTKELTPLFSLPSMQSYISHHLAARLEQEIYRSALRTPGFRGQINVHLFCPPGDMRHILEKRLSAEVRFHADLPHCVEVCKGSSRNYEGGNTSFGRLVLFLKGWDGSRISSSALRDHLDIGQAVWKDLLADERVQQLLEDYHIVRKGRGRGAVWYIPQENCA